MDSFYLIPTDQFEVESVINSMKYDSAPGIDGISNHIIRNAKSSIVSPLTEIINQSLESEVVPSAFKVAAVPPIHKGREALDCNKYAYISSTCFF